MQCRVQPPAVAPSLVHHLTRLRKSVRRYLHWLKIAKGQLLSLPTPPTSSLTNWRHLLVCEESIAFQLIWTRSITWRQEGSSWLPFTYWCIIHLEQTYWSGRILRFLLFPGNLKINLWLLKWKHRALKLLRLGTTVLMGPIRGVRGAGLRTRGGTTINSELVLLRLNRHRPSVHWDMGVTRSEFALIRVPLRLLISFVRSWFSSGGLPLWVRRLALQLDTRNLVRPFYQLSTIAVALG